MASQKPNNHSVSTTHTTDIRGSCLAVQILEKLEGMEAPRQEKKEEDLSGTIAEATFHL